MDNVQEMDKFLEIRAVGCVMLSPFSRVRLFVTLWTVAHQAPLSMGVSRQEYWSGLPFPPPGDLPDPGIEPASPTLQAGSLSMSHQGRATEALGDQDSHV